MPRLSSVRLPRQDSGKRFLRLLASEPFVRLVDQLLGPRSGMERRRDRKKYDERDKCLFPHGLVLDCEGGARINQMSPTQSRNRLSGPGCLAYRLHQRIPTIPIRRARFRSGTLQDS